MRFVEGSDRKIETSGLGQTVAMSIKADSRAFRNLVDSIYAEKEKTVARELIANALDAMAAAGKANEQIVVTLPTRFEPSFSVRDFGVGMSHEFIMEHYKCLFDSTKQGDNKQTGMFGVGSKSPLAITDTFTIKCFDADSMRLYVVSIPEEGVPQISLTAEAPTEDKRGGVEIVVPISAESRRALLDGLVDQQFFWFDKPIKFEGAAYDEIKTRLASKIITVSEGVYLARGIAHHSDWSVCVRQGAAVYPLIQTQISPSLDKDAAVALRMLCESRRTVCIDLPIGTAEVTLARENIQYGPKTVANIVARINEVFNGFKGKLEALIGDAADYRSALEKLVPAVCNVKTLKEASWSEKRLAACLLPLLRYKIGENFYASPDGKAFKAWHDSHDNTPQPCREPLFTETLSASMITRGRAFLHHGTIYDNGGAYVHISGADTSATLQHPCIIYVLPTQLPDWQKAVKEHVAAYFKNNDLGATERYNGIPLTIIRVGVRTIDTAIELIKDMRFDYDIFTYDDLPLAKRVPEANKTFNRRNYSKTSVYAMDRRGFEGDKIEPDYMLPAYYVARVGLTHEVTLCDPDKSKGMQNDRRSALSNNSIVRLVDNAGKHGLINKDWPVYRVTDKQAEALVSRKNHAWKSLANELYANFDKLNVAKLADSLFDAGYATMPFNDIVNGHNYRLTNQTRLQVLELVQRLCDNDPIFKVAAAVNHYMTTHKNALSTRRYEINDIASAMNKPIDRSHEGGFEKLQQEASKRYRFLYNLVHSMDSDSDIGAKETLHHAAFYLKGLIMSDALTKPHNVDQKVLDDLGPIVQEFEQYLGAKVEELEVSLVKAKAETEEKAAA